MNNNEVELRVDARALVGEGPIWDVERQVLYWVDILSHKLYVYDPVKEENQAFDIGQAVGTVVPRVSGGLMLAMHHGFAAFELATQTLTPIHDPEAHLPANRFNDGKCDPAGRFWAGTMAFEPKEPVGSLYCMEVDLSVRKVLDKVTISNGITWSLDKSTMYYIDTPTLNVRAFDYDLDSGNISNERVVIEIPKGTGAPDGMDIDAEGMLWIALYGGSRVCRYNPQTGELLHTIPMPASRVTACAFGGRDLDTLFITTACQQMTEEDWQKEPNAGGLFSIKPGYKGVGPYWFKG